MMKSEEGVSLGVKDEARKSARGGRGGQSEGRTEYLRRKQIHEGFNKKLQ